MANRALLSRDVLLDLLRLHEELLADVTALLKEHGVTAPQYNVLRILRGAGPGGLTGTGLAAAMITRVPDVTRLVDRLEGAGLVRRERCREDRRVVHVRVEAAGLALLATLPTEAARLVMDVSGDGRNNQGRPPGPVRDIGVAAGVSINALAVLNEEPDLLDHYRAEVIGGPGSFAMHTPDYASFAEAIREKLLREAGGALVA